MPMRSCRYRSFLAGTIVVFLLAFSFNAYACLVPLSGTTDASMANGCSTPMEQPARQLCDAFKTLGVASGSHASSLLVDHHLLADHALAALLPVSHHFQRIVHRDLPLDMGSPPHQSLATTVLRI
jgi:hypothetical protein